MIRCFYSTTDLSRVVERVVTRFNRCTYIHRSCFIVINKTKLFNKHLKFSDRPLRSQLKRFDDKKEKEEEKGVSRTFATIACVRARMSSLALSHTDYRAANVSKIMREKKKNVQRDIVCMYNDIFNHRDLQNVFLSE